MYEGTYQATVGAVNRIIIDHEHSWSCNVYGSICSSPSQTENFLATRHMKSFLFLIIIYHLQYIDTTLSVHFTFEYTTHLPKKTMARIPSSPNHCCIKRYWNFQSIRHLSNSLPDSSAGLTFPVHGHSIKGQLKR